MNNVDNDNCFLDRFPVEGVKEAMKNVKCGKRSGLDGISGDHLKYVNGK